MLTVLDEYTRECLEIRVEIRVEKRMDSRHVMETLEELIAERGFQDMLGETMVRSSYRGG